MDIPCAIRSDIAAPIPQPMQTVFGLRTDINIALPDITDDNITNEFFLEFAEN
jgi:hypothetical protein